VDRRLQAGCDIFQAEFAEMLTLGPWIGRRVPMLFVHHQLHFVYVRRFLEANPECDVHAHYQAGRIIREEAAYLDTFDAAITFSATDRDALRAFRPSLPVHVSPFPSPAAPLAAPAIFDRPVKEFAFVASETNGSNLHGLIWFMKEAWPEIKTRLPDARVIVIGKWSQAAREGIPGHEGIEFPGFSDDLGAALRKRIMIVPLWVGSGIRTKILSAWCAACPVVSTSMGAEGLPGRPGEHYLIADDPRAFADACVNLSREPALMSSIAAGGLALVKQHFSLDAVRAKRLEIYGKLIAGNAARI
jgi:glycosyltransferase involved in cell wall biosynthesis